MAVDRARRMQGIFLPAARRSQEAIWQPAVDVYRTQDGWLVKFELAGVRPEDIRVNVHENQLSVSGSRRDWCLEKGCRQIRMEISYSRFERSIELPATLRGARVVTEHRHGLLLVRLETEGASNE